LEPDKRCSVIAGNAVDHDAQAAPEPLGKTLVTPMDLPVHPAHDPGFRAAIGAHTDDSEQLGVNVGLDPRARACAGDDR
jgi:hypothetical protein